MMNVKSERVAGRSEREGAARIDPTHAHSSRLDTRGGADQALNTDHLLIASENMKGVFTRLWVALVAALVVHDHRPRISLVAAFMESNPQARGQSLQVSFRSPDVDPNS
jgi:hypothetical protein